MKRKKISSGTPWEPLFGHSRALRVGNVIYVSGTTAALPDGSIVGKGDAYKQTRQAIEVIRTALEEAGSSLRDVVRTRMFVTEISAWRDFALAHREVFGKMRPALTFVEVKALVDPRLLVEIEAEAVVDGDG